MIPTVYSLEEARSFFARNGSGSCYCRNSENDGETCSSIEEAEKFYSVEPVQFAAHFDFALASLRTGKKVARSGWNGEGMYIYLVPANRYPAQTEVAKEEFGEMVPYQEYIAFKTVNGTIVPWCPSQTDLLAGDWKIV